jgi:hypothetical protein
MEDYIKVETQHEHVTTDVIVDNSSDWKDFKIIVTTEDEKKEIDIQYALENGEEFLSIGGTPIKGRQVALFREFINQKLK